MFQALEWKNNQVKATLFYKILNDHNVPNLKESLMRRNVHKFTSYDLKNSQNVRVPHAFFYIQYSAWLFTVYLL